jgi:hypothetical protein
MTTRAHGYHRPPQPGPLKRKLQTFTADSDNSLRKRGFDAAPGICSVIPPWSRVRQGGARTCRPRWAPKFARVRIRMGGIFTGLFAGAVLAQAGNIIILAFACL